MIGKYRYQDYSGVDASLPHRLAGWIDREMQLSRLHEEILARREALINCSITYHQSQGLRTRPGTHNLSEARERNRILLRDIGRTQMNLYQEFLSPPSPRFTTLQKNYWAMVKSQLPLWEQDMGFRREETRVQQHTASQQQQQQRSRKKKKKKPQTSVKV
ncbi:hypothetical protein ACJMK2_008008, partial [Sinanodonta woodiana]